MNQDEVESKFGGYLKPFANHPKLRFRVLAVLSSLPEDVSRDFLEDSKFHISLDNFEIGRGSQVWMACPGPGGEFSRSVVLKPRLEDSSEAFAKYVIAHEFAHAYLRNGGWNEIDDPELAADALAASWGFVRDGGMP